MLFFLLIFSFSYASKPISASCPAPDPLLESAKEKALVGEFESASADIFAIKTTISCRVISPEKLSRLWFLEGVLHQAYSRKTSALESFHASSRLGNWDPDFGAEIFLLYRHAAEFVVEPVHLSSDFPPFYRAYLNGKGPLELNGDVPSGLNLIQITDASNNVVHGEFLNMVSGSNRHVSLLPPTRDRALFIAGVALGAGALVTTSLALYHNELMRHAQTLDELDVIYSSQVVLGSGAIVLSLSSAVSFGLYWLW